MYKYMKYGITDPMVVAVACAAIFVPLRVFLNPSQPHVHVKCTIPLASVTVMIVLFGVVLILTMGNSLNCVP